MISLEAVKIGVADLQATWVGLSHADKCSLATETGAILSLSNGALVFY